MPKYLFEATYVGQGIKGLMQEGGTARREALTEALKSMGGTLESFYYAFGYYDVLGVFEVPDDASAAALSLLINSSGNVNVRLKPLLTVEDIDEAAKKTPSYRAPGKYGKAGTLASESRRTQGCARTGSAGTATA